MLCFASCACYRYFKLKKVMKKLQTVSIKRYKCLQVSFCFNFLKKTLKTIQ